MKTVTQHDIAKALGVSQSAVGLAIGGRANHPGKGRLKQETIDRILEKAQEMGYRPHRQAQIMRQGKSMQIGLAYSGTSLQIANEREAHVTLALRDRGYQLVFLDTQWCRKGAAEVADYMLGAHVDGLIVSTSYTGPSELSHFESLPFPVVGLSSPVVNGRSVVSCDMADGMRQILRHLIAEGHRRIVHISATQAPELPHSQWHWYQHLQALGLETEVREAGGSFEVLPLDRYAEWTARTAPPQLSLAILCPFPEPEPAPEQAQFYGPPTLAVRRLLRSGAPLPDAIVCSNDDWAFAIACELIRSGVRIPEDVAITGFNDSPLSSYFVTPLTTVRQPTEAMCKLAVDLLIREIQGEPSKRGVHRLPGDLIIRDSSCRIRK